jgi:hypothetical protein
VGAIYPVIRAHHRVWISLFDADLEREKVSLPCRRGIDVGAKHRTRGFLGVQGIMLDRGDEPVALDAAYGRAGDHAGQQRIFAHIFEIAAVAGIAREVRTAREQNVEPLCPGLRPDHRRSPFHKRGIKGSGHRETRGKWRRHIARAHIMRVRDA